MVFWAGSSTKVMQRRVQELGGMVQPSVNDGGPNATTHVVCAAAPPMTTKHVLTKLQGYQGPAVTVRVVDGTELRLPAGVTFVLPEWVARSIGKQALQPAQPYLPPCLRPAPPPVPAHHPDTQGSQEVEAGEEAGVPTDAGCAPANGTAQAVEEEEEPASSVATLPLTEQELAAAHDGVVDQPTAAAAAAAEVGGGGSQGEQQQQEQEHAEAGREQQDRQQPAAAQQRQQQQQQGQQRPVRTRVRCRVVRQGAAFVAVEGVKPQYTGGLTGIPWGSYGVWDEPCDPVAARETRDKLLQYWYNKGGGGTPVASPPSSPQAPPRSNGVCPHVCCSRRPYCLVAKLEQFKTVYMEAKGTDQFRMKAIDRAAQELARWAEPLQTEADVDRMGLAKKSAEKVKEILLTGTSSRVEAAAADERRQVLNLLLEVWGVGPTIAQRWYDRGIRSLDDVRARAGELSLSEQQRTYLKYVEDLSMRIPRAEITRAEATVREACFDLVDRKGGACDCERTYCQATGSYRRGKEDSGDIDFLMCLPPSLQGISTHAFLSELLGLLLDRNFLLDEMSPCAAPPDLHAPGLDERASWMGLCRVDGGPARRVDVKVYTHAAAPFAVNYFANSQAFCRATRHWANNAVPEKARRYNPVATGFKISDIDMLPIVRQGRAARRGGGGGVHGSESEGEEQPPHQQAHERQLGQPLGAGGRDSQWARTVGVTVLGPAVHCADETAIFKELGLSYVPVRMRIVPQPAAPS